MQAVSTDEDDAQQADREPGARGGARRDCNHRRSRYMRAAAVAALLVVLVVNMPSSTADDQPAAPTHHHSKKRTRWTSAPPPPLLLRKSAASDAHVAEPATLTTAATPVVRLRPPSPPPSPPSPPPPSPPPPPPRPPPPPSNAVRRVEALNARFRRPVTNVTWEVSDGALPEAGVLVHVIDGREHAGQPWRPNEPSQPDKPDAWTTFFLKQSASLIYAEQRISRGAAGVPLFGYGLGVIFKPGVANRAFCGFGSDAGGRGECHPVSELCRPGCSTKGYILTDTEFVPGRAPEEYCDFTNAGHQPEPDDGTLGTWECGGKPWRTEDFADFLTRGARSGTYNEIIVDSRRWDDNLPESVEFLYYGTDDPALVKQARDTHKLFLETYASRYRLTADDFPLLILDKGNWETPFRIDHPPAGESEDDAFARMYEFCGCAEGTTAVAECIHVCRRQ